MEGIKKTTLNKVHVDGFYEWMLKIKNIHLADNQKMSDAYNRVILDNNGN